MRASIGGAPAPRRSAAAHCRSPACRLARHSVQWSGRTI